ncbi:MAG: MerR family transcriptional regulator [Thomasclavelia sp.]|jgi:DNA-binding transcriptional MerR regulator|nr:MerR family transcriptional regulator [Thomasclavelia sp.]
MKIGQVAKEYGLSADTLRYYEKTGLIDPVEKDQSGIRNYQDKDLRRIRFIKIMREAGLSIQDIKQYVDLFHQGLITIDERKTILDERLKSLYQKRDALDKTINELESLLDDFDNTLLKRENENYGPGRRK